MSKAKVGDAPTTSGLVVSGFGRHYIVESASGERTICHPRGKKSLCVVGDRVRWQITGDEGVIEELEPRRNLLYRQDEWKTKAFAANLDQVLVMVASEPVFSESQLARALKAAAVIAGFSLPVVMMVKESVNRAFESSLNEGLLFERRAFHASFGLEDQKEGMAAFVEKRKANFRNR